MTEKSNAAAAEKSGRAVSNAAITVLMPLIVAADQTVKHIISSGMQPGDSVPVISGIFHITYVRNYGAAFSTLQHQTTLLRMFPLLLVCIMLFLLYRVFAKAHWTGRLALGLVAAGGIGNLIDRFMLGYVVDMFDFRVWPVFNIADIACVAGCGLLALYVLKFDSREDRKS